jgi:AP-2 complex subunit alpha
MLRLTIRATDDTVAPILLKLMQERLAPGVSTIAEQRDGPSHEEISDAFGNVMVN